MFENSNSSLQEKYLKLQDAISEKQKLLVAYSGGVDSALLAQIAYEQLGDNAWAVLIDSETVPKFELEEAEKLVKKLGINFEILKVSQLEDEDFTKNDTNRCYYCRRKMAEHLIEFAKSKGITTIAAGAQASDLADHRPGIKAFQETNIWHPFIELNFSKDDIRTLARTLNLPVAKKPSQACLSSRITYGQEITHKTLEQIAAAENFLREQGFTQYRARVAGQILRIEVYQNEFDKLMGQRKVIIQKMKELGFTYITLDLEGFRSGSMNEAINNR